MQSHYHLTTLMLLPGSRLAPGNWGRMMRFWAPQEPKLLREQLVEQVRATSFAHLPSRLNCNFIFDNLEHAHAQRGQFGPHFLLYEVRIVEETAPTHRAAFNLLRMQIAGLPAAYWGQTAIKYWAGQDVIVPEVLTASPIEILRCLD